MSRFAYVNGQYVPQPEASTHIEDRGYQFADGIYEVIALVKGNFIDFQEHLDRLDYSLAELRILSPLSRPALVHICQEIIRLNRLQDAMIYIQVSRGIAPRYHSFPKDPRPILVVTARHVNQRQLMANKAKGVAAITLLDNRWARPDIKSISLLPNILSKQQAEEQGCYEAILYKPDGTVTEASATNVWIVRKDGVLQTHPLSQSILGGITRQRLIGLVQQNGITVEEKAFSLTELKSAQEVILSASVSGITPVTKVDQTVIGDGQPGAITQKLMKLYLDYTGG
ncbi:D-amino-acid transaminase [Candidatus Odyssella acanthamoebae]|uniref:Probable branched-chain-amino-acid aminotransferase n=1 Tax=Candidatus Odyssella acanthamoebae TaxID=91604 RepID=A0A077AXQ8_9PROT|nr:D-amino-acid transaminase [Candidatus Paracaedibacter acanthamoebae]AIK95495.1 D-amino acid aminotransferase [Candidatus Paracaedibacter acanthamoebae]